LNLSDWIKHDSEREYELLVSYRSGDDTVLAEIVRMNYKLISRVISAHFSDYENFRDDLFTEGVIGIAESAKRWEPEKHKTYNAYKCIWMKKYMRDFLRKECKYRGEQIQVANDGGEFEFRENLIFVKLLVAEALCDGMLTIEERDVVNGFMTGFSFREIDDNLFLGNKRSFAIFKKAKVKLLKIIEKGSCRTEVKQLQ